MSRDKLVIKYAALDTPELPERIYEFIAEYIVDNGIDDFPNLELSGRWTGSLSIDSGGWRNDFDLVTPLLSLCKVDRNGEVLPDMAKISERVEDWRHFLHTPDEYDECMGADDESFDDRYFADDETNNLHSMAYINEIDSFLESENPDMLAHDKALTEIDKLFGHDKPETDRSGRMFEEGYSVKRISSPEELQRLLESMENEVDEGEGISWTNPDFKEDLEKFMASDPKAEWLQWLDDLRNGRFGDLPEDFDGLSKPEE